MSLNSITFDATKLNSKTSEGLDISAVKSDISVNNLYIEKDGKPLYIVSGEFQYSRYPHSEWETEILKMKACGINAIATYSFWNHHEYKRGEWNFEGDNNLHKFVELCDKNKLFVILRVGPYCHGEALYGGFPKYVFYYAKKRSNDKKYLSWVENLYSKYYAEVKEFLYPNGSIIAMQLDNEFTGNYGHLKTLKDIAVKVGFKLPIYTVTAWSGKLKEGEFVPLSGTYPEAPWEQNIKPLPNEDKFKIKPVYIDETVGNDSIKKDDVPRKNRTFERTPLGMCELGAGVQVTKHRRPIISDMDAYSLSIISIAKGVNILGYYIFHGGRNPNFAPLQETRKTFYPNNLPLITYDFQAPINEYGYPRSKYHYLKLLHYFCLYFDENFAEKQAVFSNDEENGFTSSIRIDGNGAGYHFINTYERRVDNNGVNNLKTEVLQGKVKIELPSVSLPNGNCFFYPFNLTLGDATIDYITAQPLLKIKNGASIECYFIKHNSVDVKIKYSIKGKTAEGVLQVGDKPQLVIASEIKTNIYVLDMNTALKAHYKHQREEKYLNGH